MGDEQTEGGESTSTVVVAAAANLGIAAAKLVAGLISGSSAMLSEAAHSVADTVTELMLLTALKRSEKPPDEDHPLGYGPERYVWAMLAAVATFVGGAVFSLYDSAGSCPVPRCGTASPRSSSASCWCTWRGCCAGPTPSC